MVAIKRMFSGISGDIAPETRDFRICTWCVYLFVFLSVQTYGA
jgi:hypothetical protein